MTILELCTLARALDFYTRSLNQSELATSRAYYADAAQKLFNLFANAAPMKAQLGSVVIEISRLEQPE